jgi:hypothetical protein
LFSGSGQAVAAEIAETANHREWQHLPLVVKEF